MKKHSKTGVEARYQGTVLGQPSQLRSVKIEGGPVETLEEWAERTRQRSAKLDSLNNDKSGHTTESAETNGHPTDSMEE
jgi:transcription initiation factor TFIID subunit 3